VHLVEPSGIGGYTAESELTVHWSERAETQPERRKGGKRTNDKEGLDKRTAREGEGEDGR
jgi:hypothetical protein